MGKNLSLYIAHGEKCHCVTVRDGLQTVNAVDDHTVVIKSPDTDVAVIAVSLEKDLQCRLYFHTGVANRTRIIDLAKVTSALGPSVCSALTGIHTFSGSDTTSAFHDKGEKKTFSVACEKEEYLTAFRILGRSFNLDQSTFKVLCKYVCHLYGQSSAKNVNDVRYKAFCMASSALPELSMPPTSDALHQHCKRANYQAAIMRCCLQGIMCAPSPIGNGWHIEDGELTVTCMTNNPAAQCDTDRCSCMSARLSCTDLCMCQDCVNVQKEPEDISTWDADSDSDGDD